MIAEEIEGVSKLIVQSLDANAILVGFLLSLVSYLWRKDQSPIFMATREFDCFTSAGAYSVDSEHTILFVVYI